MTVSLAVEKKKLGWPKKSKQGRWRVNRYFSQGKKTVIHRKCGKCGGMGHNRKTCTWRDWILYFLFFYLWFWYEIKKFEFVCLQLLVFKCRTFEVYVYVYVYDISYPNIYWHNISIILIWKIYWHNIFLKNLVTSHIQNYNDITYTQI